MRRLGLIGLAIGIALLGFAGKSSAEPEVFVPRPEDEGPACEKTVDERPKEWSGVSQGDIGEVDWLARVAFHRVYGAWPKENDPAQVLRLAALIECVTKKLAVQPPPKPKDPDLPVVAEFPIPGTYYRIQPGDQLLGAPATGGVTSRAYGTSGNANYQASKLINDHPYNAPFRRLIEAEKNLYPLGRITFNPGFGTFAQQFADPVKRAAGLGNEYAVIYIPEAS